MKRMLLTAILAFTGFAAQAQLPDGSTAPDFTVTDVFGGSHTLSAYLAQGKTVVIDISATWCGPCWGFHNSGMLEELYYSLGEGGSGEVVILLIEGDPDTSEECLFGVCPDNFTQGNWVQNTPYPVIDSAEVAQMYQIQYFPTLFKICPNGIISELTPSSIQELISDVSGGCGTSGGILKNAHPHIEDLTVCSEGPVAPQVTLTNFGTQTITSATLKLYDGTTVVATKNFSGSISTFDHEDVNFDPVDIAAGQEYTVKVTAINNTTPQNTLATTSSFLLSISPEVYNEITIKILTDMYADEISWAIKNSAGSVVVQDGPYQADTESEIVLVYNVTLPANITDCYSVEMYDSYGDGWLSGQTAGRMEIWSGSEMIFYREGRFDNQLVVPAAFRTNGSLNNPGHEVAAFGLYPNPSGGILYFSGTDTADVVITDMAGKTVFSATGMQNGQAVNLSSLQKGLYVAGIVSGTASATQKIVLN